MSELIQWQCNDTRPLTMETKAAAATATVAAAVSTMARRRRQSGNHDGGDEWLRCQTRCDDCGDDGGLTMQLCEVLSVLRHAAVSELIRFSQRQRVSTRSEVMAAGLLGTTAAVIAGGDGKWGSMTMLRRYRIVTQLGVVRTRWEGWIRRRWTQC